MVKVYQNQPKLLIFPSCIALCYIFLWKLQFFICCDGTIQKLCENKEKILLLISFLKNGHCSISNLIKSLVLSITLEQMEMSQNVTFVSFDTFYWESDVKNQIEGYVSIKTFCEPILRSTLWVFFKYQK